MNKIAIIAVGIMGSCSGTTVHVTPSNYEGVVIEFYEGSTDSIPDTVLVDQTGVKCLQGSTNNYQSKNIFMVGDSLTSRGYEIGELLIESTRKRVNFIRYRVGDVDESSDKLRRTEDVYNAYCAAGQ